MNLLLFGLVVLAIFLFGVFVMAIVVDAKHGDDCCTYKLYAVRDRLVSAVVFHNVSRDDPWFNSLYENVNSLLIHSHFLAGPKKWDTAAKVGKFLASHPHKGKRLREVPSYEPPREIAEILPPYWTANAVFRPTSRAAAEATRAGASIAVDGSSLFTPQMCCNVAVRLRCLNDSLSRPRQLTIPNPVRAVGFVA